MTRVLITADAVGGVWTYAAGLAAALPALGVEPVLVLTGPAPSEAQRAELGELAVVETGLPLDWLAGDADAVRRAGGRVAEIAADLRADVVQLNAPALADETRFPAPVIAVAHSCVGTWWQAVEGGELPADLAWREAQTRRGLHAADLVIAPSRAFAAATQERHGLDAAPYAVHNGRRALPVRTAAQQNQVLTAGRLWDRGKGVALMDRVAARISVPFFAAGPTEGPNGERISLEHLVGLGTLGPDALAERLAPRPIFASAALYEPFGLAVLEAAQAGCALVLSDIPTFRELWAEAALLVPPGDVDGFVGAIERLVEDPAARAAAGAAAQARARCYSLEAMAADMAALIHDLNRRERLAA